MKNTCRVLGIITLIAIIGFTFAACDDDTTIGITDLCANGHDGLTVPKAATCTEAGNSDKHGTCTRCGQTITGTLIPALGHHAPNSTYPACIEDGNTGIGFCQRQACGEYVTGTAIPALGHAGLTAPKAATCTAAGNSEKYGTCTRCEQSITGTVIPALGHHAPNGTYPTCTENGNTGTGICQRQACGAFVAGTEIPALRPELGHDHGTSGTGSLICKREHCNHQYTIGDRGPAGGIIFYVAPSGIAVQGYGSSGDNGYFAGYTAYYLEAAPKFEPSSRWGADETFIAGITTWADDEAKNAGLTASIGVGRKDTQTIVNNDAFAALTDTAAQRCANKDLNGFTDWFLPSLGELNEMYKTKEQTGIPTLYDRYCSSSQHSNVDLGSSMWGQYFGSGTHARVFKDSFIHIHAVRAF